jgi:hypothetical protein
MILRGQLRGKVGRRRDYERPLEQSRGLSLFGRVLREFAAEPIGAEGNAELRMQKFLKTPPRHAAPLIGSKLCMHGPNKHTVTPPGADLIREYETVTIPEIKCPLRTLFYPDDDG